MGVSGSISLFSNLDFFCAELFCKRNKLKILFVQKMIVFYCLSAFELAALLYFYSNLFDFSFLDCDSLPRLNTSSV